MSHTMTGDPEDHLEQHQENFSKTVFGFWTYLMTDCVLFGMLFATFAVLHKSTFGGPGPKELFSLPYMLVETMALLLSSFTCGLAGIETNHHSKKKVIGWYIVTFLLGLTFLVMEIREFTHLALEGNSWQRSAFLSSYFTLVGTHGFHITMGLIWILVMIGQVYFKGLTWIVHKRLTCLRLFWHFLDLIWIFIFTFVYLMEAL